MKTSTNKTITGWNNTFVPKNLNVNVREWLKENGFDVNDVECIEKNATFANFKNCIIGQSEDSTNILDYDKMDDYCDSEYMDSFLRDAIFDAVSAIA